MLNRRSLRIKVMQYLYALERHKEAYQLMGQERAGSHFDPDLNVDELPDLEELDKTKKTALKAFEEHLKDPKAISELDDPVQEALKDGLAYYKDLLSDAEKAGYDALIKEADWVAKNYIKCLMLPVTWKDLIVEEWNKAVGSGKNVSTGMRNLAANPLIKAIEDHPQIRERVKKDKIGWDTETVSEWLRQVVKKDETYQTYSETPQPKEEEHIEAIGHIFKKIIFKNEVLDGYMEENDLAWAENKSVLKSMVVKTLKTYDAKDGSIELINLSPNWAEDKDFFRKLYQETIRNDEEFEAIISDKSQNWDVERIAAIDIIILKMAITEFIHFPSIPVKVTINEYIELCKTYSTPKSKQYVNGILDVISTEFIKNGKIKKSGRGLLDNK